MHTYKYPRAALTVDAIILEKKSNKILLIQRAHEPFAGEWALPGGFVEMNELLIDSCKRELEEETKLQISELKQFKTYDAVDRDPRGRTISVVYYGFTESEENVEGSDDAAEAKWFPLSSLPKLAFDHEKIITDFQNFYQLL